MAGPISQTQQSKNINPVQLLNATNAFKSTMTSPIKPEPKIPQTGDGTEINDCNILDSKDIHDIQKYATMAGESDLSVDDIKYGLSYGRSVIVEYLA